MTKQETKAQPRITVYAYIAKMIEASGKTQREIAREIGFANPNIISMYKTGETKIPLDKVPDLAKAIFADPGHLFRLALEQYWPGRAEVIQKIFGGTVTEHEQMVLQCLRLATNDMDPEPSPLQQRELTKAFTEVFNSKKGPKQDGSTNIDPTGD